jgi:hypothetical protein
MRSSAIAAAVLVTLLAAASARAQTAQPSPSPTGEPPAPDAAPETVELEEPEPTQGHFIALGFHGIGAMAFDADRGTRDPTLGQAVSLRLGESVTDWLTLSLAFAIGSTSGEPRDSLTLGRFGITSQWYFTDRWFIQAGFGALYAQGPDPEDHDLSRGRYGDVYLAGVGYDFYISDGTQSGGWVLTPMLSADVGPDSDFTTTSLSIGIELSYWTGLARDKLKLPTPKAYAK